MTAELHAQLALLVDLVPDITAVDPADQPHVLARHVYDAAHRALSDVKDPERRVAIVNNVLTLLLTPDETLTNLPEQLFSLTRPPAPGSLPTSSARPSTPLSEAALLTNAHGEPSLGSELRAELDTADQVDLLCAFVKWHGLRVLEPEFRRLCARRAPLRVVTTTYIGATERAALERLIREFGAEVKIQYDAQRTRLHAKAWLFRRNTEFDTAYVGSSNLSKTALLDGVEWNVRLSRVATPTLLSKFQATFDTYWNDSTFETYDPESSDERDRLDDALAEASGSRQSGRVTISLSGLEVTPYPFQKRMLEELDAERTVHGRNHNLIVAATGTGKTVVAALDYRRLCGTTQLDERPSLLFVAHRQEILVQSLRTYREVLAEASFGEQYVGGTRPERWRHVFASVQSLTSYGIDNIPPDAFDIMVIDEFHHAAASSYRRILDHLEPKQLLGLTATPERADGFDVRAFFGGRIASELRLWDALCQDLLCPFHYFGIADNVDLTQVAWTRGRYDETQLANLYTGNSARAATVIKQLRDKLADVTQMRALGFCVSIDHANYMAGVFNEAGIPALAVTGMTRQVDRDAALADLRARRVNVLFTADLFNEGLDMPDVDTILFLRPTESATIFLQQLGRGLRRSGTKAVLTALDFVGHHRKEFRFDTRYQAMTGATRKGLERQVERGFPFLPSGCQIILDQQAQGIVLANIKAQLTRRWPQIVAELRSYGDLRLATFLSESGVDLADVLRGDRSWTRLRREAGLPTPKGGPCEGALLKRCRVVAHVDDRDRAVAYLHILSDPVPSYASLDESEKRYARMLFFSLWPDGGGFSSYEDGLSALRHEPAARAELASLVELGLDLSRHVTRPLEESLAESPLRVHAIYSREEILTALDYASLQRRPNSHMQGVVWAQATQTDAFLVTLRKSEVDFSPTTMYRDYAISPTLFHWESQSTTSVDSPTGRRYLRHRIEGTNVLIFVRDQQTDELGAAPYLLLGSADYVSHAGSRPIGVVWKLRTPMPAEWLVTASVV